MPNAGCVNTRAYNARRARIVKNTFQTGKKAGSAVLSIGLDCHRPRQDSATV